VRIKLLALVLSALAAPAAAGRRAPLPAASEVLSRSLAAPGSDGAARERVQAFGTAGARGRAKAQMRLVRRSAGGARRIETIERKAGPPALLIVDDGKTTMTAWPRERRAWLARDPAADAEAERARLESLYDMTVSSGGRVARKSTWRLDLRSKADGRLRRSLWIAKNGGLLLRREDYRPDGTLLRRVRVTRLLKPDFPPGAFVALPPEGAQVAAAAAPFALPAWLPDGFVLLEAAAGAGRPASATFTDGLVRIALTVSGPGDPGTPGGAAYAEVSLGRARGRLYFKSGGTTLAWSAGGREYRLSGDLAEGDLARMAASLPEAR
jgi:hypothetical protein